MRRVRVLQSEHESLPFDQIDERVNRPQRNGEVDE
jgi:hypothetical protein